MPSITSAVRLTGTFIRSGLLNPGRPDRVVRQFSALARWGLGLAGEYISAARRDPDRVAIIDEAGSLTFDELDQRTDRLAGEFARHGTPKIGVLCRNHRGPVEAMLAASKLGCDVVLLNTGLSGPQMRDVRAEQGIDILVADEEFLPLLDGIDIPIYVAWSDSGASDLERHAGSGPIGQLHPPKQPGRTIILTSGTTGTPKGARRPLPPSPLTVAGVLERIPLHVGDRLLVAAPLFHAWGYGGLQFGTGLRATIVLRRKFEPGPINQLLADERCSALWATPVMLSRLLEAGTPPTLDHLRIVASSGSALPGDLALKFMDAYGDVLYNFYGSTEASWVAIADPEDLRAAPGTAGRPPIGTRLVVFADDGTKQPQGQLGKIFVHNEMLFDGYTNGATKEIRDGFLRTGDIGHLDSSGRLFVNGREDDMVISGGENVYPREVEDLLVKMSGVRECCVAGVEDLEWGHRLAAWIVLDPGVSLDTEGVRAYVRENLARFSVPRDVYFIEVLPRNAAGKVLVRDLLSDS